MVKTSDVIIVMELLMLMVLRFLQPHSRNDGTDHPSRHGDVKTKFMNGVSEPTANMK